jgi:very-short-patch-repair endonuclease
VTEDGSVHVTTGLHGRLRVPGIAAHRRAGFTAEPPHAVVRDGFPVTRLEQSLVDAWPLATADSQRAPLLYAIGQRMTTPDRVTAALQNATRLPGRDALRDLLRKLRAGCRSELELWGFDHILTGPDMPAFEWQVKVRLGTRTVYLDAYDPVTRTNFELDGARWHASPRHRERDLRRDAALAALGILVVRFTHYRLVHEPEQVRREVLAILAARG